MRNKGKHDNENKEKVPAGKERLSEILHMKQEIERLKAQVSKLELADELKWNKSVVEVIFRNEGLAKKYKSHIESFLKDLLEDGEPFAVQVSKTQEQEYVEEMNQAFCIDKLHGNSSGDQFVSQNVPAYSISYDDALYCVTAEMEACEKEEPCEKLQMWTCFNCLGNHHLRECTETLDRAKIAANRKDYQTNSSRYHQEEELNSNMQPGHISTALREALGLRHNQLPIYIYHMRVLGYPPGWMKEAMFETSGLSLYDTEGKAVAETHSISLLGGNKYDGTKFFNYPGFNSPTPDGFKDEWKTLNMPPIQAHQQLSEALKSPSTINGVNVYKKRNLQDDHLNGEIKKSRNGSEDTNGSYSFWTPIQESTPKGNSHYHHNSSRCENRNSERSSSISVSFGTPILAQQNLCKKLPDSDKFAKGITEHMPFENLPDSIGTFEKMRGVLSTLHKKQHGFRFDIS